MDHSNENVEPQDHITSPLLHVPPKSPPSQVPQPDEKDSAQSSEKSENRISTRWTWIFYTGLVIVSALVAILSFTVWLVVAGKHGTVFTQFSGEEIGGRFTQAEAKAIDVVYSAIVVPCLIAALNYLWFASARVSIFNEADSSHKTGIPLASLITASSLTSGSYDVFSVHSLLRGRTWKLSTLAVIAIVSAIGKSTLSNIIAYEAFSETAPGTEPVRLRYLSDPYLNELSSSTELGGSSNGLDLKHFDVQQQMDLAAQVSGLLTGLKYVSATSKLQDGAYIGPNSTSAAMDALPVDTNAVFNVPGFRMTVDCSTNHTSDGIEGLKVVDFVSIATSVGGYYYGNLGSIMDAFEETYQFLAFSDNATKVTLGFLDPTYGAISTANISSDYGLITAQSSNVSVSQIMDPAAYWGIQCWISRSEGLLNYTRDAGREWVLSSSQFSEITHVTSSALSLWQAHFDTQEGISVITFPGSSIPAIGPALLGSAGSTSCSDTCDNGTNFSVLAHNYLYASGEAQRIAYGVAANASTDEPRLSYNVTGMGSKQYYRITYVPALLLVGLLALTIVAILITAMALYNAGTHSARTFRQVNPVRLIVDCGEGLREDITSMAALPSPANKTLDAWAAKRSVVYSKREEVGRVYIRLDPAPVREEPQSAVKAFINDLPVPLLLLHKSKSRKSDL